MGQVYSLRVNLILASSIVPGSECVDDGTISSVFNTSGYNIFGDISGCTITETSVGDGLNDIIGQDPLLSPLADNGGNSMTHALLLASPALNAIAAVDCTIATDQRGISRPQGSGCDVGAFELVENLDTLPAPSDLSATPSEPDTVELTWVDNAIDESEYVIERSNDDGETWTEIAILSANSTTYSDTNLDCERKYEYRVRAYRTFDNLFTTYSNIAVATTTTCPIPRSPIDISVVEMENDTIILTWEDDNLSEVIYEIERRTSDSDWEVIAEIEDLAESAATESVTTSTTRFSSFEVTTFESNTLSFTDNNLLCGQTYEYRMRTFRPEDGLYSEYTSIVTVTTPPCLPSTDDLSVSTNEDEPVVIAYTGSNIDDTTIDATTSPTNGLVAINADNTMTYTPNANYAGNDSFTYTIIDSLDNTSAATVQVQILPVNDAPVASDDSYVVSEDTTLIVDVGTGLLANDSDIEGDTLTVVDVSTISNGTLDWNSDGSFTYTPSLNYVGDVSFTYRTTDGESFSEITTVIITVLPVDDLPELTVDENAITVDEGQPANNSGTISDADNNTLFLSASVGMIADNHDGTWGWSFTPSDGSGETQTVIISAEDGEGNIVTEFFDLTVNNVNPTAVLVANPPTIDEGTSSNITFTNIVEPSSEDEATLAFEIDCTSDGIMDSTEVSFDCLYDDDGIYTVTGRISDKDGGVSEYSIVITVVNVAPIVNAGDYESGNEGVLIGFNGSFADGGSDEHSVLWDFGDGTPDDKGVLMPFHRYDDNGEYIVSLTITDDDGASTTDTLIVTILNVAPTATFVNVNPEPIFAGEQTTFFFANASDVSTADAIAGFQYQVDCEGDTIFDFERSSNVSFDCQYDNAEIFNAIGRIVDKDGGYTDYTAAVVVLASPNALEFIMLEVETWVDEGHMSDGVGHALITRLQKVQDALDDGKSNVAVNLINANINHISALANSGRISSEDSDEIINLLYRLMWSIIAGG